MLMCNNAYYGDDHKIYCKVDDGLCGHQKWCDMSMKYKLTTAECTRNTSGKEKRSGRKKRNETGEK